MASKKTQPEPDEKPRARGSEPSASPGGYQVLARRFRPRSLDELVGQEAILETLRRALDTGAVPHAFLFSGSRGVGKTTMSRIIARCLNCEEGISANPCGKCKMCRTILDGTNGDVLEIDAASHNLVDDIRELRDRVGFASMGARYKVYTLDEVHMLTRSAFNAFLKTLEEPPPNVVFILATTELHKVPDTIRSRCQVLLFQSLSEEDIVTRLRKIGVDEGLQIPEDVYLEIARAARGGMRDSETMLERILPVAREKGADFGIEDYRRLVHRTGLDEVVKVVGALVQGEAAPALRFVDELVVSGVDEREVLGEVLEVLRAVMLLKVDGAESGLVRFGGALREQLLTLAKAVELPRLDGMIQAGLLGRERIRRMDDRRLVLEISMLRMAEAGRLPQLAELIERLGSGSLPASAPRATAPPGSRHAAPDAAGAAGAALPRPAAAAPGSLKDRVLAACRKRKGILAPTLEYCAFSEPGDDGVVRVVVDTELKLHRDRMQSKGVQDQVTEILREVLGAQVTIAVTNKAAPPAAAPDRAEADAPPPKSKQPSKVRGAKPGPGAQKILDQFEGRIVDMGDAER